MGNNVAAVTSEREYTVQDTAALEKKVKDLEAELKLSEQRFKSFSEALPDLVWETEAEGACVNLSRRLKELLGREREEALGKSPALFLCAGNEAAAKRLTSCLLNRKPFRNIESTSEHKDGRVRVLESSGDPVLGEAGRFAGFSGVTRDITERKRLEEESELKAMLLDSVKDGVYLHDLDGRIAYANEAAYTQLGHTEEEIASLNYRQLLTPVSAAEFAAHNKYALEQGKAVFGSELLRADGSALPVETRANVLELDGERYILRVVRDVTERKRAEMTLRESEEKFRVTFESAPVGMCLTDMEGRMLAANAALCAALGYPAGSLHGRGLAEFSRPDDKISLVKWLARMINGDPAPSSLELLFAGRDGRFMNAEVSAAGLRYSHESQPGLIIAVQDITARKENDRSQRKLMK